MLVWVVVVLSSCFRDRTPFFDEVGLHNPIYMAMHYHRMTYPIHGHVHDMVVHPPLHYQIVAWLGRAGLPLFTAAGVPLCVLAALALTTICRGPFPSAVQLGMILGVFQAAFLWNRWPCTLRPELHLALAWFTGLVVLESARSSGWTWGKLGLGGFLLAYASGIHYIGAAMGFGLVVYALLAWRDLGWKAALLRAVAPMGAGAALFALPYLFLWVIPYWKQIVHMTQSVQGKGGSMQAADLYLRTYAAWKSMLAGRWADAPITTALTWPSIGLGVPAALLGLLGLGLIRSTRGLALAASPHLLFVIFFARGGLKGRPYTGYYIPEFTIYLSAAMALLFAAAGWVASRAGASRARRFVVPGLAGLALLAVGIDFRSAKIHFTPCLDDLDIARAAGREMVGPGARVGMHSAATWYASGGDRVYFVTPELCHRKDISDFDVRGFLRSFDAVVLHHFTSDYTCNRQRVTVSSLYEHSILHLKGFYFSDRRGHTAELAFLLLTEEPTAPRHGYGHQDGRLIRFDECLHGEDVFACYLCPIADQPFELLGRPAMYDAINLPARVAGKPPTHCLCTFVLPRNVYDSLKQTLLDKYRLHEEMVVRRKQVKVRPFVQALRKSDQRIWFLESL
jgi:hypothetical protein